MCRALAVTYDALVQCHECGLLQRNPPLPAGGAVRCGRCGTLLHRKIPNEPDRTLALVVTGLILFVIANSFPLLSLRLQGLTTETTLFTGVEVLYRQGMWALALVVFSTCILAPGVRLVLLLSVLIPLRMGLVGRGLPTLLRYAEVLNPWGMPDVFMLGILVSVVKLADTAVVVPGASLSAFVALTLVLAAVQVSLSGDTLWSRLPVPDCRPARAEGPSTTGEIPAFTGKRPVHSCPICKLVTIPATAAGRLRCPRCGTGLHRRELYSRQRTWALVIAAGLCYLPANLLPIMTLTAFGKTQSDTILSGVIFLINQGMWPLALVVFVASVLVPLTKLGILTYLLISIRGHSSRCPRDRTHLYRITELVGRWSMVDIYVVTLLVALVRLGNLATIEAGPGAIFFAAVVIITLLAAKTFDPRLIWDHWEPTHGDPDKFRSWNFSSLGTKRRLSLRPPSSGTGVPDKRPRIPIPHRHPESLEVPP